MHSVEIWCSAQYSQYILLNLKARSQRTRHPPNQGSTCSRAVRSVTSRHHGSTAAPATRALP
eukprot:scaffold14214_cov101-Isochrysis_galbana.AAC.2